MSTVRLIRGDCLQVLPTLDAGSIDAVVTDPPYGIGYFQHSNSGGAPPGRKSYNRLVTPPIRGDDRPFDPAPWLEWPCLFWGANHCASAIPRGGSWIGWDKAAGGGPDDNYADGEFAWCSVAGIKRNVIRYTWKGVCRAGENNRKRLHPMQKPVALMARCIEMMDLPPGATIIDPYMGSGTTGVAAVRLGFNFVGVEIDPGYFAVAQRRIEAEQARHPLFEVPRPVQVEMFA